ncbi:uncharacterized protein BDR25DRAFT_112980 [Lindgomyces ingoldianus]|uniref:Uncharacterized protein n=1 Tax=Lindgomyces ingoldianus TaxID=673940 RepID=A0ACB6R6J8_9PLEO|nr:uncharacterized protein BDR25DRAFT_112980 [Lindgomyces ingoldianus]KAF2474918.1 hypothetical protein BDR25DRAFT_112980 [Lindgomyces ingoldianus]
MLPSAFFSLLGLHISWASAAPAGSASIRSVSYLSTISSQCINTEFRQNWFIGECLTGEDATTRVKSAVYMANKVENDDGELKWKNDGRFDRSCNSCNLINGGATLNCNCRTTYQSKKNVSSWVGTLNLDEHISLYSGHLLSNLAGAPTAPTTNPLSPNPNPYPIPSSFTYSFGGTAHCPDTPGEAPGSDYCAWIGTCSNSSSSVWTFDGPINCYVPVIYFPQYHYQFESFKLLADGAWEVLGWGDEACTGEPVERVSPDERGVCKGFGTKVRAISVRPAFSGDPR